VKKSLLWLLLIVLILVALLYKNFTPKEEIKIGFVAGLSGKYSLLGQSVLNGFLLKFDEVDYTINKQHINIIQKDDEQNEQKAKTVIKEFLAQDVDLIVGNTTSSMTKVSLEALQNNPQKLIFSITASSNEFSSKEDNFLRVQVAHSTKRFDKLSNYLIQNDLEHVVVIYDSNNQSYSNNYLNDFQNSFIQQGGIRFVKTIDINQSYEAILEQLKQLHIDLITISANAIDSAKLIQFLRLHGIETQLFIGGWAKSEEFILNVGEAGEGILVSTGYDENAQNPAYLEFVKKYIDKYNEAPTAFSAQAYEAATILIEMIEEKGSLEEFKTWVLSKKVFEGLQGEIAFDQYGDVERENFLMQLQDGEFIRLDY
jgi:branched-chain amino acid transport system substrate-binding protein